MIAQEMLYVHQEGIDRGTLLRQNPSIVGDGFPNDYSRLDANTKFCPNFPFCIVLYFHMKCDNMGFKDHSNLRNLNRE